MFGKILVLLTALSLVIHAGEQQLLTAVSYNIRYDAGGDKGSRDWSERKTQVGAYLSGKNADFIGLQEALKHQLSGVSKSLPGYGQVGVGRDNGKNHGEHSQIFYRKDRWTPDPEEQGTFWLSDTPDKVASKSWGNSITRICTWARFTRDDGESIYVYNTHWDHRSQKSREKSADLILKKIRNRKHADESYLVMGDFNATISNVAIRTLLDSGLLRDHGDRQHLTFNRWKSDLLEGERIDHIFASPDIRQGKVEVESNGDPAASDHHPVVSYFQLPTSQLRFYIGTEQSGIYTAILDAETGKITKLRAVSPLRHAGFQVISNNGKNLYTIGELNKGEAGVFSYRIALDGTLVELSRQPADGKRLCHISLSPDQSQVYAANYSQGRVVSFPQASGVIGKLATLQQHEGSSKHPQRQTKPHAHAAELSPDGKFLYVPDLGLDRVKIYAVDQKTAALTPSGEVVITPGSGPRHMKFHSQKKIAYILNELSLNIGVYSYDPATGKMEHLQTLATLPADAAKEKMFCSEILVSGDGKFVYCANRDLEGQKRDSISVFKVGDNGLLEKVQTTFAGVSIPRHIQISPDGDWLLVAGQKSNNVAVLRIDKESGNLKLQEGKVAVSAPKCIRFLP